MEPGAIEIGTSGWRFDDWVGTFYPHRVPRSMWLEYYSARFSIGEINSTYYRIGRPSSYEAIAHRTPERFRTFAKVHADVTHRRDDPSASMEYLLSALQPLIEAKKLIGLLAQFPSSFRQTVENAAYIFRLRDYCQDIPLCVELRHRSWLREDMMTKFSENHIIWVSPDEPDLPDLLPFRPIKTSKFYYLRLHGRNSAAWYNPQAGNRYDYLYSEEQLRDIGSKLLAVDDQSVKGFILFNNCHFGQAPTNAWWLKTWLDMQKGANQNRTTEREFDFSED